MIDRRPAMHLRDLECFLAVADQLHFGRAADRLHVSQSAVSQSVRRLENELGNRLFDRTSRVVALTAFGSEFHSLAERAHRAVLDAYQTGRQLARGPRTIFVLGYARDDAGSLLNLVRAVPTAAIELRNMTTPAQLMALRQRRIDAALGWEIQGDDEIETAVVTTTGFTAILPQGHRLAGQDAVSLHELAREPVIGWPTRLSPELTGLVVRAFDPSGRWRFAVTATSLDENAGHVLAGLGVGIMPTSLIEGRPVVGIAFVPVSDPVTANEVLAWRTGQATPILSTVRDLLLTQ